jgi:hypothetical protein
MSFAVIVIGHSDIRTFGHSDATTEMLNVSDVSPSCHHLNRTLATAGATVRNTVQLIRYDSPILWWTRHSANLWSSAYIVCPVSGQETCLHAMEKFPLLKRWTLTDFVERWNRNDWIATGSESTAPDFSIFRSQFGDILIRDEVDTRLQQEWHVCHIDQLSSIKWSSDW